MRCDKCHKNEATIQFTPVVGGKAHKTIDLCNDCVRYPRASSIEAIYRRVTPETFARLQSDAKAAEFFFAPDLEKLMEEIQQAFEESADRDELLALKEEQDDGGFLFIGTNWHALHFVLTGDGELKPPPLPLTPLWKVALGGTETPWPCTHGYVRSFMPDEVRAVAEALIKIPIEALRSRCKSESFNAAQITPRPGLARWNDEDARAVFEIYPRVVEYFRAAARDGDIILLSFD